MKIYSDRDFLADELFVMWRLSPTEELDGYWAGFLRENPESRLALEAAIRKFSGVRLNERKLSGKAKQDLFARIMRSSVRVVRRRRMISYSAAAACFAVLIVTAFMLKKTDKEIPAVAQESVIGTIIPQDIRLITGDSVELIDNNASISLSGEGCASIAEQGTETVQQIDISGSEWTTLIVPEGRLADILLPDGTKVWLNADSEVCFPTVFPQTERGITVKGEAYLEVAHEAARPFIVSAGEFSVRVLGTRFNISAYEEDDDMSVVLAEGSVEVAFGNKDIQLEPGEKLAFDDDGDVILSRVDVNEYISWKDGYLTLRGATVNEILSKIGRRYDIKFSYADSDIMDRTCTGKLLLSDDADDVLDIVCAISGTVYERAGDTVYISDRQ